MYIKAKLITYILRFIIMKQTSQSRASGAANTGQASKSIPKNTVQKSVASIRKGEKVGGKSPPPSKYKIDAITK